MDDRENASGLPEILARVFGFPPRIERLQVGDILVGKRYLIERKTTDDFAASVLDGRLFRQAAEMSKQNFEPVMILEGEFKSDDKNRLSAAQLRGAILSVALDWKIQILRSRSLDDTARWAQSLLHRVEKKAAPPDWRRVTPSGQRIPAHRALSRPRRAELTPEQSERQNQLRMLERIPGVGRKKALALMERFGGFAGVVKATAFDLIEVDGIGPRLAEQLHRILRGESPK